MRNFMKVRDRGKVGLVLWTAFLVGSARPGVASLDCPPPYRLDLRRAVVQPHGGDEPVDISLEGVEGVLGWSGLSDVTADSIGFGEFDGVDLRAYCEAYEQAASSQAEVPVTRPLALAAVGCSTGMGSCPDEPIPYSSTCAWTPRFEFHRPRTFRSPAFQLDPERAVLTYVDVERGTVTLEWNVLGSAR